MNPRRELVSAVAAHTPADVVEAAAWRRAMTLIRWLRDPFDQHADPTHLTGSAIVLADDGRVLLHRHKRLGIWLQPGGHLEPGEAPADAATRETAEETGVAASPPGRVPWLLHVDVHEGPRGHVHLDLRYLLTADAGQPLSPGPGESPDVAWLSPDEACRRGDASLAAAVRAAQRAARRSRSGDESDGRAGAPGTRETVVRTAAGGSPPRHAGG